MRCRTCCLRTERGAECPSRKLFTVTGKVAVVTGASSGVGVAFARALAEAGADIALGARRTDLLERTLATVRDATGRRGIAIGTDVAEPGGLPATSRRRDGGIWPG